MKNTFTRIENDLIDAIKNKSNRVIALTGKWGTGKTELWKRVRVKIEANLNSLAIPTPESKSSPTTNQKFLLGVFSKSRNKIEAGLHAIKKPIYISIFGAKTISELKLRIMQNIYFDDSSLVKKSRDVSATLIKSLVEKYTGYSITDAALLLVLPQLLSERLVVIDDVERKHTSLDINELLGFLDEYSELYSVQFLVILNTNELPDAIIWKTLHEKVIDYEIKLTPSSNECFDIAFAGTAYPHLEEVKKAVSILKVNNIRVIDRILKMVENVAKTLDQNSASSTHWIPSTALLTACHFKSLENAPPFEYIKNYNTIASYSSIKKNTDPEELEWNTLLDNLGILAADDYELIIHDYLNTGILDQERLNSLFEQYSFDKHNEIAKDQAMAFFNNYFWNSHLSNADLTKEARKLLTVTHNLSASEISHLASCVNALNDGQLQRKLLDGWIASVDTRPEYKRLGRGSLLELIDNLNPEVIKKLQSLQNEQFPPLSLLEAVDNVINNGGWGDRERNALKNSTVSQYDEALKQNDPDKFRHFINEHIKWIRNGAHDENFQHALDNFINACKNNLNIDKNNRLSQIIIREFKKNDLMNLLEN